MAFNLENMTIDYKKMLRMVPSDRATVAQSGVVSDLISSLTPGQLANLFPSYYRDRLPDIGQTSSSGLNSNLSNALSGGTSLGGSNGRGGSGGGGGGGGGPPPRPPRPAQELAVERILEENNIERKTPANAQGLNKIIPGISKDADLVSAINEQAQKFGVTPASIAMVLRVENRDLNPAISGGARNRFSGLFQIGADELKSIGFTPEQFRSLSAAEQTRVWGNWLESINFNKRTNLQSGDTNQNFTMLMANQLGSGRDLKDFNENALLAEGSKQSREIGGNAVTLSTLAQFAQSVNPDNIVGVETSEEEMKKINSELVPLTEDIRKKLDPKTLEIYDKAGSEQKWNIEHAIGAVGVDEFNKRIDTIAKTEKNINETASAVADPNAKINGNTGRYDDKYYEDIIKPYDIHSEREGSITSLNSETKSRLGAMLRDAPDYVKKELKIQSAYRDPKLQQQLYNQSGGSRYVAKKSQHSKGMAIDLGSGKGATAKESWDNMSDETKAWLIQNSPNYGLYRPMQPGLTNVVEDWHFEPIGNRGDWQQNQPKANMTDWQDPLSVTTAVAQNNTQASPTPTEEATQTASPQKTMLISMGTNDWADPSKTYDNTAAAIKSAQSKGYKVVVVPPINAKVGETDISGASAEVRRAAADAGVDLEEVQDWSGTGGYHPSNDEAKRIAAKYPGQTFVGDSIANQIGTFAENGTKVAKDGINTNAILENVNSDQVAALEQAPVQPQQSAAEPPSAVAVPSLSEGGTVKMTPGENVAGVNMNTGKLEFMSNDRELYTKDDKGNLRIDPSTIRQEDQKAQIASAEPQRTEPTNQPMQRRPQQPMPVDMTDPNFLDTMSSGSMASSPSQLRALNRAKLYSENSSNLVNGHFS